MPENSTKENASLEALAQQRDEARQQADHGGHLIAHCLGGRNDASNLDAQNANVNQRVEMTATELAISNGVYSISEEDDGGAAVFKVGLSADIKNGFGIQTTLRYFVPTGDSDIKGAFLWGAGLRYTF